MAKRRANTTTKPAGAAVAMAAAAEQIANKQAGDAAQIGETTQATTVNTESTAALNIEGAAAIGADAAPAMGAGTEEQKAQPDPQAQAPTAKAANDDAEKPYVRISAPAGPRRRAGLSFGPIPVDLTWSELGADDDAREAAEAALIDDPEIALAFYDHEGVAD